MFNGPRKHRHVTREQLLPKKIHREQMRFDFHQFAMSQQIKAAFPNPNDRLAYINNLIAAMDENAIEMDKMNLRVVTTGRTQC